VSRIVVVGGAGYVGVPVADRLLRAGHDVKVLDNITYGPDQSGLPVLRKLDIEVVQRDLRDEIAVSDVVQGSDSVVVLAGLVGDPIVRRYPDLSFDINVRGMKRAVQIVAREVDQLVFVSTCSNYGLLPEDQVADEETILNPVSDYARAKVEVERHILQELSQICNTTILRFATAFGVAPRMRFDLTVNEFAKELALGRRLSVYDPDTWRPYCHVRDFAEIIARVVADPPRLSGEILNAGDDRNNFTKRQIAELASEIIGQGEIVYVEKGSDPRNYKVSFSKIRRLLEFECGSLVADGIREVGEFVRDHHSPGDDASSLDLMGNYEIAL